MRFDVPAVGMQTLTTMAEVGAKVLAVESKKSLLLDKEQILREARRARISLVGYSG
jgi:DUF1009 family protein